VFGTFLGLQTAVSGLQASQAAIDTVSHNVANADTPGYSRQTVNLSATPAIDMPGLLSANPGQIGTGVQVQQISRMRSNYLDEQYQGQNSYSGYWNTQQSTLNNITAIINEPSDTGISTVMQNFFSAWSSLSANPSDLSARTQVQQTGITLAQTLNQTAQQLDTLKGDTQTNLQDNITQANTLVSQIADINKQINAIQQVGDEPNDLLDQRGQLLDQLSNLANIQTSTNGGVFTLSIAGQQVLQDTQVTAELAPNSTTPADVTAAILTDTSGNPILDPTTGNPVTVTNGVLGGLSDSIATVDSYNSYLNDFANTLATGGEHMDATTGTMVPGTAPVTITGTWPIEGDASGNTPTFPVSGQFPDGTQFTAGESVTDPSLSNENIQIATSTTGQQTATIPAGVTVNVSGINGLEELGYSQNGQGQAFFSTSDGSSTITADNIAVSISPADIAAAFNNQPGTNTAMAGDGTLAMAVSNLANSYFSFQSPSDVNQTMQGTPDQMMQSIVGTLGVQSQTANQQVTNQQTLLQQIDNQRQSISGVSIDQELSNMIQYQQAYNASARIVSTINSMLQTVVSLGQ